MSSSKRFLLASSAKPVLGSGVVAAGAIPRIQSGISAAGSTASSKSRSPRSADQLSASSVDSDSDSDTDSLVGVLSALKKSSTPALSDAACSDELNQLLVVSAASALSSVSSDS